MDKREIQGTWWFPQDATKRWIGRLSLPKAESPRLNFIVPNDAGFAAPPYPSVLLGEDEHAQPVSLLRLGRESLRETSTLSEVSYQAGHAFTGVHIHDTADLLITTIDLYIQQLVGWVRRTGFEGSVIQSTADETTLHYRTPPDLRFNLREGLSLELVTFPTNWDHGREQGIREDGYIYLDAPAGIRFQETHNLINSLAQILHFATLRPIYPIQVKGTSAPIRQDAKSKRFEWISGWMHDDVKSEIDPDRWVFQFPDVQNDFGAFCSRWFHASSTYQEALSSYFTTVHHPLPDSVQHLCLTQALEAYHGVKNAAHHNDFELKIRELAQAHRRNLPGFFDSIIGVSQQILTD